MSTLTAGTAERSTADALGQVRDALENPHGADLGERFVNMWYEVDAALRSVGR